MQHLHLEVFHVKNQCWMQQRRLEIVIVTTFGPCPQVVLTQQPALFDRAFQKLFSEEIAGASEGASRRALAADRQDPATWALQRFWERQAGSAPALAPRARVAVTDIEGLSRYETDFQARPRH